MTEKIREILTEWEEGAQPSTITEPSGQASQWYPADVVEKLMLALKQECEEKIEAVQQPEEPPCDSFAEQVHCEEGFEDDAFINEWPLEE